MIKALTPDEQGAASASDYQEAIRLLAVLTEAQNQIDAIEAEANAALLEAIDDHKKDYAKLQDTISKTQAAIETIARLHPEWFSDGKTVKTPYGSFALKKNPPKLNVKNEELTLVLIEQANRADLLRETKALDLEALSKLTDDELAKFRITRTSDDRFEAKPAKLDMGKAVKAAEKKEAK
jgi:uncharacterized caspase-like protein